MEYELIELIDGSFTTIYTLKKVGCDKNLFQIFCEENNLAFGKEVKFIKERILAIADETGARAQYFRENEGNLGDGVCALYDEPDSNLRLYCIRYGQVAIILGGGGHKPKPLHAFQESEKLTKENYLLRAVSRFITNSLKENSLEWIEDGRYLVSDDENIIIEVQ